MKVKKYPDGASYVCLDADFASEKNKLIRVNSYNDLWVVNQFADAYCNAAGERPCITIPCLIDAQADRRFKSDQSSGLKLVCDFLNRINSDFKIFHPHNPEVVEALMDNVEIIDNSEFITTVLESLKRNNREGDLILMSSDAGGFKPLMKLCDKINWKGEVFSASKARTYINNSVQLTQIIDRSDFGGKDVLIVDDICVFGGTFKGLSVMLKERNIRKLYLSVSHMTVQNLGDDPVTNYFDNVFTTNSKFDEYYHTDGQGYDKVMGVKPTNLEVIKLF